MNLQLLKQASRLIKTAKMLRYCDPQTADNISKNYPNPEEVTSAIYGTDPKLTDDHFKYRHVLQELDKSILQPISDAHEELRQHNRNAYSWKFNTFLDKVRAGQDNPQIPVPPIPKMPPDGFRAQDYFDAKKDYLQNRHKLINRMNNGWDTSGRDFNNDPLRGLYEY